MGRNCPKKETIKTPTIHDFRWPSKPCYLGEYYCVMSHHQKTPGKLQHFSGVKKYYQPNTRHEKQGKFFKITLHFAMFDATKIDNLMTPVFFLGGGMASYAFRFKISQPMRFRDFGVCKKTSGLASF